MTRRTLVLLAVLAAPVALPAAAPAATVGISDQQASTFSNPNFPLIKSKVARYIAPYDVMSDPDQLARMDAWIVGARSQRQRILIHFEHSRKSNAAGDRAPSPRTYERALRAFKRAYRDVRDIGVWNEANRKRDKRRAVGQPTAGKYKLLADYYKRAKRVFRGRRYNIVALDVLDENNPRRRRGALDHIRGFQRHVKDAKILGFHNYSDTNRFSQRRSNLVRRKWKGSQIWLTETGGIVKFASGFPYSEERAAAAIGCMFTIARNRKYRRLYIYQFNASDPNDPNAVFDAGLIRFDGTPRPGLFKVAKRERSQCKPPRLPTT